MTVHLHKNDLPADIKIKDSIAIDTETMGLIPERDGLCLVQLSTGDGTAHIIQLDRKTYKAPNLIKVLKDKKILKIFHYARFDVAIIKKYLDIECTPIYCTRTASKLVRTYTDKHGLREVCRELAGVELNKQMQSSDWGNKNLTKEQLDYAANDVLYLHTVMEKLDHMLKREGRTKLAEKCFEAIHVMADLDLEGWGNTDFFGHS